MRLKVIDYDAMRTAFNEKFKETYQLIQNGETELDNLAEGFHEADCVIWSLPTIEAGPVRHGKWFDNDDYMFCSCCGMQWNYCDNDTQDFKFCPHCGAKMDKEEA